VDVRKKGSSHCLAVAFEQGLKSTRRAGSPPAHAGVRDGLLCGEQCEQRHDVSMLIGVGRYFGSHPGAKTSMTIMRPPQRGQGQGNTRGSSDPGAVCS
jgi:hypothetical protein